MKTTIRKLSHRRGELFEKTGEMRVGGSSCVGGNTSVECLGQRGGAKDRRIIVEPPTGFEKKSIPRGIRLATSALETNPTNRKPGEGAVNSAGSTKGNEIDPVWRQSSGGVRTTAGARSGILRENSLSRTLWPYGLNRCRVTERNVHAP